MSMSRFRTSLLFILFLIPLAGVFARDLDEIVRSGKIYMAFTGDDLKNINYDLAHEFARYLNVEVIEVEISWEEAFMENGVLPPGLETDPSVAYTPDALKKADIICSTFTIIDWRKKLFGLARTLESAELLVVSGDAGIPAGYEELAGKLIAFTASTTFEQHLKEINASSGIGIRLVPTGSSAESRELLEQGEVFGIILDADEALNFTAASDQKYRIAFPISEVTRVAWAVEKNNPLLHEVENFFETITSNKVLDGFFYQRFGITYTSYLELLSKKLRLERYHRDLDEILASKKLVVALRDRSFIYREGGQKQFMHALAEEFAEYLGVNLEFVVTPYFAKYWETRDGEVIRDSSYTPEWFNYFDLACEVIAPLDWRANKVNMVPVYPSAYTVVARKDTRIRSLEDLRTLKGVTNEQSVYEDILMQNGIEDYYYEKVDHFLSDVEAGKADYTIIYNAFYELSAYPELESKLELGQVDVCWALRKDQPELEKVLRQFISRSRRQGLIGVLLKAVRGNTLQTPDAFLHSYYESFQTGQLPYVNYGADNGLPQEDIFSIFQDRRGYLWFGTNSGAVRYNGREMLVFNQEHGLPGNSVRDIGQDSSGTMYFATTNGIAKFRGDITCGILLEGLSFNRIFIDSKDRKWFMGDDGVHWETREGEVRHLNDEFPQLPATVNQMAEDPVDGRLFLATILGVYSYDPDTDRLSRLSSSDSYSLFIDANDSIWISTIDGLFITHVDELSENRMNGVTGNLNKRFHLPVSIISDISSSRFGAIWLVTDSKIFQVISPDQEPIVYEQEIGIKNNKILSFLIDQEDNIWIGFSGGLQRLTSRRGLRNFYPATIDSYIYSVFQDGEDRIWIASDNGIFHFWQDQLVNYTAQTGSLSTKFTGTLLENGNILLASKEGLYEVGSRTLQIIRHTRFPQVAFSPENVFVTSRGEIFLLTGINGVIYYFSGFNSSPIQLKNKYTANIFQLIEHEGKIIGGNSTGFVEFDGTRFRLLVESPCNIWSLSKEGTQVWVGTDCGIGLVRDGRFDQMELFPLDRELVIKSILPARNRNYLWLGTNKGFSYFNTSSGEFDFIIDTKDGLSGDEITPGGLFLDGNDLLWVGTYHGISNFNIRAKSNLSYAPVCYIEKLYMNGEMIEAVNGQVFAHNENNFIFEISALSFSDEASVEYEYYLRGTGNKYSSYHRGKEYTAHYNNLPPGRYEFIFKAKGKNNIWGYTEKYEFTIRKAWYNTWPFRILVLLFVFGSAYLFYVIRVRTIKAQRNRLEVQVRERTHELEVANTEIEAQRDFARFQRDQIAQQQKSIMDSIHYAQTIQDSLLPGEDVLQRLLPEHFIVFKPRDIVSGDFYWVKEGPGHFYVAAADCTGHGVPGAFMSMLGMTLLNEGVGKDPGIDPADLLDLLRKQVIETLHQKGDQVSARDGMDLVVCKYIPSRQRLLFAGANNPLYLIREGELTEYKTDPMSVSIHPDMKPFTGHELLVRPGDLVYLFSDGFADQFGGPEGKKFKYRALKELLMIHEELGMAEQGRLLGETFDAWKGELGQVDDVMIIGMKF
jgi:ligand-binding sensor domain-containing protein/serine phosphatase RsbU (regulator of sigma subunit)/ABC-type amino acid transport substrate-binding protein